MKNKSLVGLVLAMVLGVAGVTAQDNEGNEEASKTQQEEPTPPPPEEPKSLWEKTASSGLTVTQGNSDTSLFTVKVQALKKWGKHDLGLGASGTYGENEGETTTQVAKSWGQYNRGLAKDGYFMGFRGDVYHDDIADLDYRVTVSPLLGYYFIQNDQITLSSSIGPGAVHEKQGGTDSTYFTVRLSERLEYKINDRSKIWQTLEFMPQVDEITDNWLIIGEVGIDAKITDKLSLQSYVQLNYDNEPAKDRKKDDWRWINGIAYSF